MKTPLILLAAALTASCSGAVVRDRAVYRAEVRWSAAMHVRSAKELLRLAPTQTASVCARMADLGLTLQTLAPHHAAMALWLAGEAEADPGPAPAIPPDESVCGVKAVKP